MRLKNIHKILNCRWHLINSVNVSSPTFDTAIGRDPLNKIGDKILKTSLLARRKPKLLTVILRLINCCAHISDCWESQKRWESNSQLSRYSSTSKRQIGIDIGRVRIIVGRRDNNNEWYVKFSRIAWYIIPRRTLIAHWGAPLICLFASPFAFSNPSGPIGRRGALNDIFFASIH